MGALLAIATLVLAPPCAACVPDEHSWDRMEAALQNLGTADTEVKRDIAEDAYQIFAPLFDLPPGRDEKDVQDVVADLRHWVTIEKDDWISTRLLQDLKIHDDAALEPLFLDALKGLSPNLRWSGILWFSEHADPEVLPELEYIWRHEDRSWVQADLITALALHGSNRYVDEFRDLARSDDPALAEAAIDALGLLAEARAAPVLVRIATKGPSGVRVAAIRALAAWSNDPETLEVLLGLSRSADRVAQAAAVRTLASSTSPDASERVRVLTLSHGEPSVRLAAAESLTTLDRAGAVPVLVEILHEPAGDDDSFLHSAIIRTLMDIDDPSILEALADVDLPGDSSLARDMDMLRESLGRDRSSRGKTIIISTDCSFGGVISRDPSDPRTRVIVPPPGLQTLRCWQYPGVAGDPEEFPRLPAGTPMAIEGHFELDGESWAAIETDGPDQCWVPLRFIESPAATHTSIEVDKEETMLIRREFDLPAEEVESDVAQGLMDAGLLEVIEPGDEVIGVAMTVDPQDLDRVLLLARSCGLNETMLDGEIYDLVSSLAPLYGGHPALDRFRKAPQVRRGETDEVIDLDLKELTDQ